MFCKLKYETRNQILTGRRNRSRKITWFNPPFSKSVSTKIGATFLRLIDTCFPPSHPLSKIINRNTVNVSYRCMPNMGQVIAMHNTKIAKAQVQKTPPGCNCQGGPTKCPVNGACQTEGVVYEATVVREDLNTKETYTGLTSRTFKERLYEHRQDWNNQTRKGTALSNYVWKLKDNNTPYRITWKFIARSPAFNPTKRLCNLCLKEKYFIMFRPEGATLNKRSEFFATCRHRLQPLLANT